MIIAKEFIGYGFKTSLVLRLLQLGSSSFYYKPKDTSSKRGKSKTQFTRTTDDECVKNEQVVKQIEALLEREFVDYGYRKVTHYLRQKYSYVINEKKVYRLMKEQELLQKRNGSRHLSPRQWVKELVPNPQYCFEHLEVDIKYIWIAGQRRNALLLTIIDVQSRWVMGHYLNWKIRKGDVLQLFDQVFNQYPFPSSVYVRNDNGSQFEASMVQQYFEDKKVIQEFTKPATPEQNAHIESYHSIVESVICRKYEFENLVQGQDTFNRFIYFYNYERLHSGIKFLSPSVFLKSKGIDLDYNYEMKLLLNCTSLKCKSKAG